MSVELARGSLVPVLMGGAGILRFRPEAGSDIRRVQLRYGAGLRTRVLDLFEGEMMVERSSRAEGVGFATEGPRSGAEGEVRTRSACNLNPGFE